MSISNETEELKERIERLKSGKADYLKRLFDGLNAREIGEIYACSQAYNKPMHSCIYFIKNEYTGLFKIGQTNDLAKRVEALQSCFTLLGMEPQKLRLIGIIATFPAYTSKLEKVIHESFESKRTIGEWFNLTEDDIYQEIFIDTDFERINDVFTDYSEWEYLFYNQIQKSYELSYSDIGLPEHEESFQQFGGLNFLFKNRNKLSEIVDVIEKNKIGFYSLRMESDRLLHRVGISYDKQNPICFSDIKRQKFDRDYWINVIKQINSPLPPK
jgi:hypothetical protein